MCFKNKEIFFSFFWLILFCLFIVVKGALADKDEQGTILEPPLISVEFVKKPLKNVVEEVSKQTGYTIEIEEDWAATPITGIYKKISLPEFLNRIFRKQNVSILIDDNKKVVSVRLFGSKSGKSTLRISNSSDGVNWEGEQEISDLKAQQDAQLAAIEEWKNDPNAIDPYTGQKVSALKELQAKQLAEIEEWKNDPNAIDPYTGQEVSELKALQAGQIAEIEEWKNDPNAIDPYTGQKVSDLKALQAKQLLEIERWKNDPDAIDPYTGKKLSDLKALRDRQLANALK